MKAFKLTLSADDVNLILGALGALPYHTAFAPIQSIHAQCQAQVAAGEARRAATAKPEPPAKK